MISTPKYGWSSWELQNFKHPISYIDDFPLNILNKIIDFFNKEECQELEFDAEGYSYKIYLGYPVFGEVEKDDDMQKELVTLSSDMVLFTNELLTDLERDIFEWSQFPAYSESENDRLFIEKEIIAKIKEVRGAMKKWMEKMV